MCKQWATTVWYGEPYSLSVSVTNFFQSFKYNNFRQEKYQTHEEAGFRRVVKQEAAWGCLRHPFAQEAHPALLFPHKTTVPRGGKRNYSTHRSVTRVFPSPQLSHLLEEVIKETVSTYGNSVHLRKWRPPTEMIPQPRKQRLRKGCLSKETVFIKVSDSVGM